jgi:hypothetical protein
MNLNFVGLLSMAIDPRPMTQLLLTDNAQMELRTVARDGGWKPFPERNKSSLSDSQFVSFS